MSWGDFWSKMPNQAKDFDPTGGAQAQLSSQFYEDITPEWGRAKGQLGDYQKFLATQTYGGLAGGKPEFAPATNYKQERMAGRDANDAREESIENMGISAAILAAIFGGSSLAGGGSSAGGSGGSAGGSSSFGLGTSADAGFGSTDLLGSGAYGSTGSGVFGGSGGTYGGLLSGSGAAGSGIGNVSPLAGSIGGSSYSGATTGGGGGSSWFDKLTESLGEGSGGSQGGGQQNGGYDSMLDNMLKLSPWTVARRDPARMAQLLALLKGKSQGGVLGY